MRFKDSSIVIKFTNDKIPEFVEPSASKEFKYVKYGETNDYPNYLLTLFNRSAKHNAICTSKQTYIKGKGFTFEQTGMMPEDVISLKGYVDQPNPYESLTDLLNKTCLDLELFGGFYLRIIGAKGKGIAEIYHEDYSRVRSNQDNSEFYVSDEWITKDGSENTTIRKDKCEILPAYDESKKQKQSIFYYKSYRPGLRTYTLPEYIGAIPAIITDAEIANFHRAEIQNSFKGSKMIVFKNGVPSDDELKTTERKLKSKFTPTDQSGSLVVDFVDDPQRVPEIIDLSGGDFAVKYQALNDTIQQEIFVGHKIVSPMLFGVRVEGQLGGRAEMIDAYNLFQNIYIAPKQEIQVVVFDYFAPVKGKLEITPLEPIMPSFSEAVLEDILHIDEMREIIGRKPLDAGVLTVGQSKSQPAPTNVFNINDAKVKGETEKEHPEDDEIDFEVFQKYGEPIENFESVKFKKVMLSVQEFALSKMENAVLDLIKKTPNITPENLVDVLKINRSQVDDILETLVGEGLIKGKGKLTVTPEGKSKDAPSFEDLLIRYRYALRSDAPALIGESRDFCQAMMDNPRYFSKQDIENIGLELGQIYGIPNYDAFRRRGGWYHDPSKDVNLPFCRHIWNQELVKKLR